MINTNKKKFTRKETKFKVTYQTGTENAHEEKTIIMERLPNAKRINEYMKKRTGGKYIKLVSVVEVSKIYEMSLEQFKFFADCKQSETERKILK